MNFIHYVESITGVDVYGLVGLIISFSFFLGVVIWLWKADKKTLNEINHIPLDH